MLTIRAATPDDIPRLASLWYEKTLLQQQGAPRLRLAPDARARWSAAVAAWLGDDERRVIAVESSAGVVGYLVVTVRAGAPGLLPERIGVIDDMAVDAHGYHPGAGRLLVSAARAWLIERGIDGVRLEVPRRSPVEQAFWRALGAKEWMDCLWMTC